ncbi:MAG: hypothetical protein RL684_653 [Pseudomonadota bacterium]|jgi:hypothetical protein
MLHAFGSARAGQPRQRIEEDYGELLIYLIRLADQLGIDLIAAAQHVTTPEPQQLREPR